MVNEGIALNACLDSEASTYDNTSTEQQDGSISSEHVIDSKRAQVDKIVSLQVMSKYEYVDQDKRSQDGKDLKEKDLKISELKSKSKDKAQDQRSHSMKEQAYNKDIDQAQDQDYKSLKSIQS
ncbi:hypothetical protein Tco_1211240 [Tanacetum coccineum]